MSIPLIVAAYDGADRFEPCVCETSNEPFNINNITTSIFDDPKARPEESITHSYLPAMII